MEQKRNYLIEEVKLELQKDAAAIDGDFIDRRIDELYALDGLSPPTLDDEQLRTAARTVQARAHWRHRNILEKRASKRRIGSRAVRWAAAVCFSALAFFSVNHITVLVTGACLPSRMGIKICCGTKICFCGDIYEAEKTDYSE
jgi:hypothetical protein